MMRFCGTKVTQNLVPVFYSAIFTYSFRFLIEWRRWGAIVFISRIDILLTIPTRMMLKNRDLSPGVKFIADNLSRKIESGHYLLSEELRRHAGVSGT